MVGYGRATLLICIPLTQIMVGLSIGGGTTMDPALIKLWHLKILEKMILFLWILIHDALFTNALYLAKGLTLFGNRSSCSSNVEFAMHCLHDNIHARELWIILGVPSEPTFFYVCLWTWLVCLSIIIKDQHRFVIILWRL